MTDPVTFTRLLVIAGYGAVIVAAVWILRSNRLPYPKRIILGAQMSAASVWIGFFLYAAATDRHTDVAVPSILMNRLAHLPTIACLLLTAQIMVLVARGKDDQ